MKQLLSRLLAFVLVISISLTSCASAPTNLTGDYRQDSLTLINSLRTAIELPEDSANKVEAQADARTKINEFVSRYRRNDSLTSLSSYTTLRTALNSLAGHYSSYPNRPLPDKLKNRLEQEFRQIESSLSRGA
ncbi:MAG TPA: photosystem II protein Psb27 [Candidatus Caenarcaniphilales bacterium]